MRRVAIGTIGVHVLARPVVEDVIEMDDAEGAEYLHPQDFKIVVVDGSPQAQTLEFDRPLTRVWVRWYDKMDKEWWGA